MSTNIQEWTEEEAFEEFMKDSGIPNWITLREPKFPICVWVEDSRKDEERPDGDDDYLLKKHFLTIERDEYGLLTIVYYVSIEPEGEENEPCEIADGYIDYRWPVISKENAHEMIPDFVYLMRFNKTT
jgi:hypothetical protein